MVDYVELSLGGAVIRIFETRKEASASASWDKGRVTTREHASAVAEIRRQVLKRANYDCQNCGTPITWTTFHMHEKTPKGRGGSVSLGNCIALCWGCHVGRADSAHGNRRPKFSKRPRLRQPNNR